MKYVITIIVIISIVGYVNCDSLSDYRDYKAMAQVLGFVEGLYGQDKIVSVTYSKSMFAYANITKSQGYEDLGQSFYNYAEDIFNLENLNTIQLDLIYMMNVCNQMKIGFDTLLGNLIY